MSSEEPKKVEPLIYWIALIGLIFVLFVMDGLLKSFGLIYLELLDKYEEGPQMTGLVATVFAATTTITGPPNGWMIDRFGSWKMLIVAAVVGAAGSIMAAFASSITIVIIGFGIIHGWGNCQCFTAATTAATRLFVYNRNMAMSAIFAGSSVGVIVYPFLYQALITAYTLRGVFIIYAGLFLNFIVLGLLLFTIEKHALIKIPSNENNEKKLPNHTDSSSGSPSNDTELQSSNQVETVTNENKTYNKCEEMVKLCKTWWKCMVLCCYYLTYSFGVFGYVIYMPAYAQELSVSPMSITTLVSVYGALELVSMISIGLLTNFLKIDVYILISVNSTIVGCFTLLVPRVTESGYVYVPLMMDAAIMGLLVGGLLTLLGHLVVDAVGEEKSGTAIGICTVGYGLGLLLPPIGYGALKEKTHSYVYVQYLSGAVLLISAVLILIPKVPDYLKSIMNRRKLNISTSNE